MAAIAQIRELVTYVLGQLRVDSRLDALEARVDALENAQKPAPAARSTTAKKAASSGS